MIALPVSSGFRMLSLLVGGKIYSVTTTLPNGTQFYAINDGTHWIDVSYSNPITGKTYRLLRDHIVQEEVFDQIFIAGGFDEPSP
jgi:hypothetical protein